MHSERIESKQNPKVKTLVKLRESKHRRSLNQFLIEGYRELDRALQTQTPIHEVYYCSDFFRGSEYHDLLARAQQQGASLYSMTTEAFAKACYREGPDGLIAIAPTQSTRLCDITLSEVPLLVLAEGLEKPGNLGALLRSIDSAQADALICCDTEIDRYNPNAIRASQGAFFSVPTCQESAEDVLQFCREKGIQIIATTPHTETIYWDADFKQATLILMGSEKDGLSDFWLQNCDQKIKIPQKGISDSLNISAAATLVVYEALRQRRAIAPAL